jgi:hypothetical protein
MVLGASEVPLNFIRSTPYKNYDRAVRVGKIHVWPSSQKRRRMSFPDRTFFAEFCRLGRATGKKMKRRRLSSTAAVVTESAAIAVL